MTQHKTSHATGSGKDAMTRSFEKETAPGELDELRERVDDDGRRSVLGAPVDPNSPTTKGSLPPGLPVEHLGDPGRATPGSGPVDNRSGETVDETKPRK